MSHSLSPRSSFLWCFLTSSARLSEFVELLLLSKSLRWSWPQLLFSVVFLLPRVVAAIPKEKRRKPPKKEAKNFSNFDAPYSSLNSFLFWFQVRTSFAFMDCVKRAEKKFQSFFFSTTSSHVREARNVTADGCNWARGPETTQKHKLKKKLNGNFEDLQCQKTTMQRGSFVQFDWLQRQLLYVDLKRGVVHERAEECVRNNQQNVLRHVRVEVQKLEGFWKSKVKQNRRTV
jgi:hypothetical protein